MAVLLSANCCYNKFHFFYKCDCLSRNLSLNNVHIQWQCDLRISVKDCHVWLDHKDINTRDVLMSFGASFVFWISTYINAQNTKNLNNYLTNRPTKQITNRRASRPSWEANSSSASQEIPRILWNPKIRYHVHSILPFLTNLSKINPVHVHQTDLFKIHSNIILPCKPTYSKWLLSFRFPHQNLFSHLYVLHTLPISFSSSPSSR